MAQKKQLSKNRKRKFLKKLGLALSLRNAFVNIHRASQPKLPTLTPGAIMSEIKPWIHPEDMAPFFTGANAIHEAILVGIDQADTKQFAMGYNNEAGTIGVMYAPKAETKSNIDDIKKHITNKNIIAGLTNDHSKFVWPEQIPYPKDALLNMDQREYKAILCGDWNIPIEQPKPGEHPLDFTQRSLGKWLNAAGSEPNINTDY